MERAQNTLTNQSCKRVWQVTVRSATVLAICVKWFKVTAQNGHCCIKEHIFGHFDHSLGHVRAMFMLFGGREERGRNLRSASLNTQPTVHHLHRPTYDYYRTSCDFLCLHNICCAFSAQLDHRLHSFISILQHPRNLPFCSPLYYT